MERPGLASPGRSSAPSAGGPTRLFRLDQHRCGRRPRPRRAAVHPSATVLLEAPAHVEGTSRPRCAATVPVTAPGGGDGPTTVVAAPGAGAACDRVAAPRNTATATGLTAPATWQAMVSD